MKRQYTIYNICVLLALLFLGGGWNDAWGQTIKPNAKGFPQPNVPTLEQTVYIVDGETRTFTIAEMDGQSSHQYAWYVRWYRMNAEGEVIALGNVVSSVNSNLHETSDGLSLFGHHGITTNPNGYATVRYRGTGVNDILICDISPNVDGLVEKSRDWYGNIVPDIQNDDNFTEPTVTLRYRYIIKPASEIASQLTALADGEALETYNVTVNKGATNVHLQMPMDAENYYWGNNQSSNVNNFTVSGGSARVSGKIITLSYVNADTSVDVYVGSGRNRYQVAHFNITVQDDAGFELETAIVNDERRNPSGNLDKYQLIGFNDFDQDVSIPVNQIRASNNASLKPFEDASQTSYGFVYPGLLTTHPFLTPKRNHYGLYRSANVESISDERQEYNVNEWEQGLGEDNPYIFENKVYDWYFPRTVPSTTIYDRTYEETNGTNDHRSGYFYYVDAAIEPGRIVNVKLNGTLCGGTELTVIAWVANMTNGDLTTPNLNFILRGARTLEGNQEEKVLHRFSTGDVIDSDGNRNLGEWMQLCYNITISNEDANYDTYYMEVQNNADDSNGNDFAFDGFAIYKNLPNIVVERKNDCSADTLFVSTDFETLMRNMGWTENQEIDVSAIEGNPDLRKYRFGLHGSDPAANPIRTTTYVGNTYFAFLEGIREIKDENGTVIQIIAGDDVTRYDNNDTNKPDPETTVLIPGAKQYRWVRVNKNLTVDVPISRFSFRAVVSTQRNATGTGRYPTTLEEAEEAGKVLNFRALKDYNYAVEQWQTNKENYKPDPAPEQTDPTIIDIDKNGDIVTSGGRIANGDLTEETIKNPENEAAYTKLIAELYMRLQIPRIRCPWLDGDELHLYAMDVSNTDLKYDGEMVCSGPDAEDCVEASGQYHVILFGAQTVNAWEDTNHWDEKGPAIDLTSTCNLMSDFTVDPSATIVIETGLEKHTAVCLGSLKRITAHLNFYDSETQEPIEGKPAYLDYIFDWYLGTEEEYYALADQYGFTVKEALDTYRDEHDNTLAPITRSELQSWYDASSGTGQKKAEMLLALIGNEETGAPVLLRTGTEPDEPFDLEIRSTQIMAMPYVTNTSSATRQYIYCSNETSLDLGVSDSKIPELHLGYTLTNVVSPFEGEVPLRLGHANMNNTVTLKLPVQSGFGDSMEGDRLGAEEGTPVSLQDNTVSEYPEVGEVVSLDIPKDEGEATISIKLNAENATTLLKEGQQYILLIPFMQYNSANEILSGECDGVISLPVKIVPEYLTWKGSSSDNWYDESKWNQSTKGELYFEGWNDNPDKDANGPDEDLTKAFSPLYFTKITIPEGKELALFQPETTTEGSYTFLNKWSENDSDSIRYEMAVADENGNILPYYINKVSEIYFKPEAMLKRQQHLNYQKAWVEFEMEKNAKYWLASPLQDVFAGDMYAPQGTARQTTPAFTNIKYMGTDTKYNRWEPAFYQKAWDKGITYYDNPQVEGGGYTPYPVSVVHSNWSIEYNNVDVPYALGKGFYASVEDFDNNAGENGEDVALVRLPKADDRYDYIPSTKAASTIASRPNSGLLAKGDVTIILTDKDDTNMWGKDQGDNYIYYADGDGKHFLIGNPYMYPLDMEAFFKGNKKEGSEESIFELKYWTLQDGASTAVVGTPDVGFGENTGEISTLGQIAPMQAFFVELVDSLKGTNSVTVKFTTDMMAANAETTNSLETRSYSATNPTLTITAERGETRSVAKLLTSDKAENGYRASEDAVVLLDSELDAPMVYTVAGSRAAQVNAVKKISNIGLGVYNAGDDEATLTISGISRMATPLYLYDAATRQSTRLEGDSYELRVSGDSHGRYFLRDAELGDELENTISIYSARPGEVIVSSLRPVKDIRVFALNGSQVRRFSVNTTRYTFTLPAGIYMIQATDGERGQTEKVLVR